MGRETISSQGINTTRGEPIPAVLWGELINAPGMETALKVAALLDIDAQDELAVRLLSHATAENRFRIAASYLAGSRTVMAATEKLLQLHRTEREVTELIDILKTRNTVLTDVCINLLFAKSEHPEVVTRLGAPREIRELLSVLVALEDAPDNFLESAAKIHLERAMIRGTSLGRLQPSKIPSRLLRVMDGLVFKLQTGTERVNARLVGEDSQWVDVNSNSVRDIAKTEVFVAHPQEIAPTERIEWELLFAEYEQAPLFSQLDRGVGPFSFTKKISSEIETATLRRYFRRNGWTLNVEKKRYEFLTRAAALFVVFDPTSVTEPGAVYVDAIRYEFLERRKPTRALEADGPDGVFHLQTDEERDRSIAHTEVTIAAYRFVSALFPQRLSAFTAS